MSNESSPIELRVLIVDDDIDSATSFSYVLQMLGCKTAVGFGGAMGVRVAQLFHPALVILDLAMPGPDGCETMLAMRALGGQVAEAVFVCLTGRSDPDNEQRCLDAGFDHFVLKPMETTMLADLLTQARARVSAVVPHVPGTGHDKPPQPAE